MLFDPERHEALHPAEVGQWDEERARDCIARIVRATEESFVPGKGWPMHPLDANRPEQVHSFVPPLYFGECGVLWALYHLRTVGAAKTEREWPIDAQRLVQATLSWLGGAAAHARPSFVMGETPIWLLQYRHTRDPAAADRLAELIESNMRHPARELMWGAPGTLLAALFMHQESGQERFAQLFRDTAAVLWSELEWSDAYGCHYWTQDLYGAKSAYMDAVHGFVGTALPLIRGRHLLAAQDWDRWQACIATSVKRSATVEQGDGLASSQVNWIFWLLLTQEQRKQWNARPKWLIQYCHGSPGFVINLGDFPGSELDELLLAAGETTWTAGPLKKGSNLCHGTGGNGYAFLKLFKRTGDERWLHRARLFAMHGIGQTETHAANYNQLRYALWTGDLGFAVYLWDCIRGEGAFPTLDVF